MSRSTVPLRLALLGAAIIAAPAATAACEDEPRASEARGPTAGPSGAIGEKEGEDDAGDAMSALDDPDPVITDAERATLREASPDALPAPPADISNAKADDAKAALFGQRLFFDPSFSGVLLEGDNKGPPLALGHTGEAGKVACTGCHVPSAGFLDDRSPNKQISLAAGWVLRRTPSLLDVGHARLLMWDGRFDAAYNQVFGAIESRDEMNSSRLFYAEQIFARYASAYTEIFGALPPLDDSSRFPVLTPATTGCQKTSLTTTTCHGIPGDSAEYDGMSAADKEAVTRVVVNAGKAIGAYERLLSCGPGRFDAWMHGDTTALSRAEQRGAALFAGKGRCATCHSGPLLTDQSFHNVGLRPELIASVFIDANDEGASVGLPKALSSALNVNSTFSDGNDGRLPTAVSSSMLGAFRTPSLRCVAMRPSFMHTAHMRSLASVVSFFAAGGKVGGYPGTKEIAPLGLTAREQSDLALFLGTLNGAGPAEHLKTAPP